MGDGVMKAMCPKIGAWVNGAYSRKPDLCLFGM